MKHALRCLVTLACCSAIAGEVYRYSEQPLQQKPLMTLPEVVVVNNWLNENHASIPSERLSGPREHAYLVIDSILKGQRAEGRAEFNEDARAPRACPESTGGAS